ncbi:MAG TPA: vitamin B12 dependent-methionine synthase activation domain-containing protein, partial [Candidatus Kapabacteria bacterium]|nr:vitamin B12 dependent-methionine synthase activation domain-containing protein [Candidatus Kapabacteria bacterium]
KLQLDWQSYVPPVPKVPGYQVFHSYPISELIPYIDWMFFFKVWQITGRYPDILNDAQKGREAARLYADAQAMLNRIEKEQLLRVEGVMGIFPANSVKDDDIEIYAGESREEVLTVVHTVRQQEKKPGNGNVYMALADFTAPKERGVKDYLGGFALTAGLGLEEAVKKFEKEHDDYRIIMIKALADRLAEAFAERLHERVRKEYWGYAPDENLEVEELFKGKYRGIRPAPGYPSCPDHSEKRGLFNWLGVEKRVGIALTENYMMIPGASVCGYYFSHPQAHYFPVGKVPPK